MNKSNSVVGGNLRDVPMNSLTAAVDFVVIVNIQISKYVIH